jgi:cell wall-associated NlpC family hydrolase
MKAEEFVKLALQYQGSPAMKYLHENTGKSLSGFDCSGFICFLLRQIDFPGNVPRFCNQFFDQFGFAVHEEQAKPGDLIFFSFRTKGLFPDHMGLVVSKKEFIHSPGKNGRVIEVVRINPDKIKIVTANQPYTRNPIGFKRITVAEGRFQKTFFE